MATEDPEIPVAGAGFGWSSILVAVFAQHLPASATLRLPGKTRFVWEFAGQGLVRSQRKELAQ